MKVDVNTETEEATPEGEELEQEETETPEEISEEEDSDKETPEEEPSEEEEAAFWQNIDEEEEVPASTHVRIKQKLKGRLKEKDSEIEKLKEEIAAIKNGKPSGKQLKRPDKYDFDTDEEYDAALEQYEDQRLAQLEARRRESDLLRRQEEARKAAVESHYDRAGEFVEKFSIAPERYKKADESFRHALETVLPGLGDQAAEEMISYLGPGSEKVIFKVGSKPELLREFQALITENPTGHKAGIFLGKQMQSITNPIKRKSQAPKPTPNLKGDEVNGSAKARSLQKAYKAAHKEGNSQKAFDIRKQARAAGINVSAW